ncbi:alpha/beta fold hydrolase [Methyloligella sp. 2.7D]|uniref:alpha/beta hydrolase family protein n=1 Tax=unclassified Methyloligella TaxID=2625955 RepID=UPI001FEF1C58|nr:alpha/beta fold hydrolase [Methyloligella sp. GL2]
MQGTLVLPQNRTKPPVVLIVPGSGLIDRDGNMPGIQAATYRRLAHGLAAEGIGSLRIDKRGLFGSARAIRDPNAVTVKDYAADVVTWIGRIEEVADPSCVFLAGHSEGGLVALAAAGKLPSLSGIILLAAPGRPMAEVLEAQLKANPANAPFLDEAMAALARLKTAERFAVDTMPPPLQLMFRNAIQDYWTDLFSYDPAVLAGRVSQPLLVVQGMEDLQIGETDARALAGASDRAELVLLPGVNHMLKPVAKSGFAENLAAYGDPELPLAPGVVGSIAAFVAASCDG